MDLFYTSKDKCLFWVAGYTEDGNTDLLTKKIPLLLKNAEKFRKVAGCELDEVGTFYVDDSSKFKFMRVFYVETDVPPSMAARDDNYTMKKFLFK